MIKYKSHENVAISKIISKEKRKNRKRRLPAALIIWQEDGKSCASPYRRGYFDPPILL